VVTKNSFYLFRSHLVDGKPMLLSILILIIAFLYACVGHGGASGYIAAMAFSGIPVETIRVSALILNICVAGIGTYKFARQRTIRWALLWPLIITSVPMAFVGGQLHMPTYWLKFTLGCVLIYSAAYSLWTMRQPKDIAFQPPATLLLMLIGAALGILSGLTGVGGGIFLSPLLLIMACAPIRTISGTSAAFILVNSLAGLGGRYISSGFQLHVPHDLLWWAVAAIVGGYFGAEIGSKYLKGQYIKAMLSVVLVIAGLKMIGIDFLT
jgi:hypothetical protein